MLKEFKAFALRGNVIDLAIGVILGIAFTAVVNALVDGVLMQIIAAIFGQPDFSKLKIDLGDSVIRYGALLTAVVNFTLIAFVLFVIVKAITQMTRIAGAPSASTALRACPYCLSNIPTNATRCSACTSEVTAP